MICIAQQEQIEIKDANKDPCVALLINDGSLDDAIEPIMYKFLQRTVEALQNELSAIISLPDKQFISSIEDVAFYEKRDNDLSLALKRRRLPRQ